MVQIRSWFTSANRLLRAASKPDRTEFWMLFRICILGIAVIGAVGFVIRYVFAMIGLISSG